MWRGLPKSSRRRAGFSLVELLISLSLVMMLTLALLSSYVFIARGDQSLANYGEMNAKARALLDRFSIDVRSATSVTACSTTSITLSVPTNPDGSTTQDVLWDYNS